MPRFPSPTRPSTLTWLIAGLMALLAAAAAHAAEVQVAVDNSKTYVGLPVTLSITIVNAKEFTRPQFPEIPGVTIEADKGDFRKIESNFEKGRMTQRELRVISYRFTPSAEGSFTIPAFSIIADGESTNSEAIPISVVKAQTSDLMYAEITADKAKVYLGQPVKLTLQIWIRQYTDKRLRISLDSQSMWSLIERDTTLWGDFAEPLSKMRNPFGQLDLPTRQVERPMPDGSKATYFQYSVALTAWPDKAGRLALAPTRIVYNYPESLERQNTVFSQGLSVAKSTPVVSLPLPPPLEVSGPPLEGRPSSFAGAVGKFDFEVSAKPTDVAVGDPITLTMTVRDRSKPATRLEVLAAPPLERIAELVDDFKVPSEALAGTVTQSTKTFTQTLRAKNDRAICIPPIPFTYFDPSTEKYVTVKSNPIPLTVKPGSKMTLNTIVESPGAASKGSAATDLTESGGGLLANALDSKAMLVDQRFAIGAGACAVLALPPLCVAAIGMIRVVRSRAQHDSQGARRRAAGRSAVTRLRGLDDSTSTSHAGEVAAALADFAADRFGASPGTRTPDEVAAFLRSRGLSMDDANLMESLLRECEQSAYAGDSGAAGSDAMIELAIGCVQRLDRSGIR